MIRSIFRILFNILFGAALLICLPAILKQFLISVAEFLGHFNWYPIAIGTVLGIVVERYLDRYFPEVATFEHEITHAIAGLPFGFIPTGITVTRHRGGECRQRALLVGPLILLYPVANRIVTLAPYFLPTFTVIMALCRPIVPAWWQPWYDIGIGITFGYHTLSTLVETKRGYHGELFVSAGSGELTQSDMGKIGLIFSPVFVLVAALAVHGLVLAVIIKGYPGLDFWFQEIWRSTNSFTLPAVSSLVHGIR